jgi:hypothetical protein
MDERNDYNSIPVQHTQTAVEWLLENIHIIPKFKLSVQDTIDKAKQMEKEQIIEAYCEGDNDISAESYYNETFKYAKIEHAIIEWSNDNTKTAGELTRQILKLVENK